MLKSSKPVGLMMTLAASIVLTGSAAFGADGNKLKAMIDAGLIKVDQKLEASLGELGTRNVAIVRVELAPGVREPQHTHPGLEFLYGLEGSGFVEIDGNKRMPLKAGSVVRVDPGQTKALINGSTTGPFAVAALLLLEPGKPIVAPVE